MQHLKLVTIEGLRFDVGCQSAQVFYLLICCQQIYRIINLFYSYFFLQDSAHRDSEPDLVFEDMTVMSDFELHGLCREERVRESIKLWLL